MLIICKNPELQNIIKKIIERSGEIIEPDHCTSIEEARNRIFQEDYRLIISGFTIPEIGGPGFIKEFQDSGKDAPFIFLTELEKRETDTDVTQADPDYIFINDKNPAETVEKLEKIIPEILMHRKKNPDKNLNEARYKSLVESMDDSIYMVDGECRYLFMNKKHLERIGRSAELFKARSYNDFHTDEETGNFSGNVRRLFSTGEKIEEKYEKNGKKYLRTFTPVRDINDERIIAASITSSEICDDADISEKDISSYIVDGDGRYLSINRHHMEVLGISCEDLFIGRNYEEFHPEGKTEKFSSMIGEVFNTGETLRDEYESGKSHFTRRFCPVKDILTGEVVAVTIVSTNITEQKLTEKSLIEANKKLNLLNSITRHDILNQMTILLGYLDLSATGCQDETLKVYLEKERKAADTIYHQILFTRDYQDVGVNTPAWQDVSALIADTSKMLRHGDIEIENRCGDLKIFADPLLEKVFYNLTDNSIRHGGSISKITFCFEKIPHGIKLICEDDGRGIPDEDKERIFRQGFGKNTGLGLFLIREILSITGLEIHETGCYGEGAKFEITIPDMMYSECRTRHRNPDL